MKVALILKILAIVLGLGVIGEFFIASNIITSSKIKIERFSLKINNLPPAFKGVKILHLTDLHSKKFGEKEKEVLKLVSELKPDFIFLTGDIIDWQTEDFESCGLFWQKLARDYPERIFGVYGNHEHRNRNFKNLDHLFEKNGIRILNNEAIRLERGREFIYLIGVDDPHLGYDNIEKAMRGLSKGVPKILLAHSPEIFRKIKNKEISLVLVGHTHGCQINIPILCDFIIPLKYDKQYKRGLFKENGIYMYVNRGIGETFLPLRFNSPPEIALIELK